MKFEVCVKTSMVGSEVTDIIEIPDDATNEQIKEEYLEWRNQILDGYYRKVEE